MTDYKNYRVIRRELRKNVCDSKIKIYQKFNFKRIN